MRPSRGMGIVNPKKLKRKIKRKDNPDEVDVYKRGGSINLPSRKQRSK